MTIQNIALFHAMSSRMQYLAERQKVIAQNIANADTPDYRPRDVVDNSFSSVLGGLGGKLDVKTTNSRHMGGAASSSAGDVDARTKKQRFTYEVAPAGNAVILEEQMIKASRNTMEYNLTLNLMRKNINLFKIALGKA